MSGARPGLDRAWAEAMDAEDGLARFRDQFFPTGKDGRVIYLAGNSLGQPPITARGGIERVVSEWAERLVEGWDEWIDLPQRLGDRLAGPILGARPGEVIMSDSTTVNLYKLAVAARDARPLRRVVVAGAGDFPTDRYVIEALGSSRLIRADPVEGPSVADVESVLDDDVALVCLSHVDFRSSAVADLGAITAAAHDAGALVLWDLSHSAGCFPLDLEGDGVDLAVGCTYKYLCGGPGAPAFLYVRAALQEELRQPIWGWWGQRQQFAMAEAYDPWPDIRRFLAGTPSVVALAGVAAGIDMVAQAGIGPIRRKALALGSLAVQLAEAWLSSVGWRLGSPVDAARRGSHVALVHDEAQRLHVELGLGRVIADFRPPNIVRFGLSPLTTRFVDVWDAFSRVRALSY
ncbi:MAG: kynureninase [Acidimicrobiales bacterium]